MPWMMEDERRSWLRPSAIPVAILFSAVLWAGVVILFKVG